jgi:cysteine desulfurase/selenocysteine lyase
MSAAGLDSRRDEFPLLREKSGGRRLVYLDGASTSPKPAAVLDAVRDFSATELAKVPRGLHSLGERASRAYEAVRAKVQRFIGARDGREIVFVRGATEAINLVAYAHGRSCIREGDEIVITALEHHSNIVPWQALCREKGAVLRVAPVDDSGDLVLESFAALLGPRTRLVAVAHASSALGTLVPVRQVVDLAHRAGAVVLVDGAHAAPHLSIDVRELDCDFYAASGHKLYGPSGTGFLFAKASILDAMPPFQTGGDMIRSVSFEKTDYAEIPQRFEAGTPNIEGAIGLGAAIDYVNGIGLDGIREHERALVKRAVEHLSAVPGLRILGGPSPVGLVTFTVDGVHPHDLSTILDQDGIAVRAGHLCAQPLLDRLGVPAAVRASFGLYSTRDDVDALAAGVARAAEIFR